MKKCSIYCEVKTCKYYSEGFCNLDNVNRVIMTDGVPACADYDRTDTLAANTLLDKIKDIYASLYDGANLEADMEVDLAECELCTDVKHNCFILEAGTNVLQDFACDERIAALVNARNVLLGGTPSTLTIED